MDAVCGNADINCSNTYSLYIDKRGKNSPYVCAGIGSGIRYGNFAANQYNNKKKFPPVINVLIMIHILLASNLGSAMDFYGKFDCWDLVMHGYFGFVAAVTLYLLLLRWNGDKLNRFGFFALIFLGTLGGAAIWEIFEFTCDTFLGSDAQRVQESLALGLSPIQDTITDIIAALVGVLVFYVGIYVVNFCNKRAAKKILY